MIRHESDVGKVAREKARQHVGDGMQIELRRERTDEPSVRLTDGNGEYEHGLAERRIPVDLSHECFPRSETGEPLLGKAHATRSAAARRHEHRPPARWLARGPPSAAGDRAASHLDRAAEARARARPSLRGDAASPRSGGADRRRHDGARDGAEETACPEGGPRAARRGREQAIRRFLYFTSA